MARGKSTISATVVNMDGDLLPYTTQSTKSQCDENAETAVLAWSRHKELGARVVQTMIINIEDLSYEDALVELKAMYGVP